MGLISFRAYRRSLKFSSRGVSVVGWGAYCGSSSEGLASATLGAIVYSPGATYNLPLPCEYLAAVAVVRGRLLGCLVPFVSVGRRDDLAAGGGCVDGWMDGWIDGWMDGWMNGWMLLWLDG